MYVYKYYLYLKEMCLFQIMKVLYIIYCINLRKLGEENKRNVLFYYFWVYKLFYEYVLFDYFYEYIKIKFGWFI